MRVVVDKAFMLRGARQEPGSVVDVDPGLARELEFLGRAHKEVPEEKPASKGPMTSESAGGLVGGGKKAKGTANVKSTGDLV